MVLAATSRTPVVSTMHNPFQPRTQPIWDAYPWFHHAVSAASAATFPTRGALPPILHGIDVAAILPAFERDPTTRGLSPVPRSVQQREGRRPAIEAALGPVADSSSPARSTRRHRACPGRRSSRSSTGPDPLRRRGRRRHKRALIAGADALLFPIEWDEPFGLVMVEALAPGRPVIGFRRASVPEVVEDGRTGFVVDDLDGMVDGDRTDRRDRPARLPAPGRGRGSRVARMVDDVEAMYRDRSLRSGRRAGRVRASSAARAAWHLADGPRVASAGRPRRVR